MTTTRTRQIIELDAAKNANYPGVLRMLRREWKDAANGKCSLAGHGDRDAVEAVEVPGGYLHNCAECKPRYAAMRARIARQASQRRSEAASGGMRGQTRHRQ